MATGAAETQVLEALVLAAGAGARFGGGKLVSPWGDGVLLHGALAAALAAPVRRVTVVTGAEGEAVGAAVRSHDPSIRMVHAPDHAEGMAASLRAGIDSLASDTAGVFVFLGDMPRIPTAVLRPLAAALRAGAAAAAPVFAGRRGHPALISRALFPAIRTLRGDEGARGLLQGMAGLVLVQAPDDGVLFDVDRPGAPRGG